MLNNIMIGRYYPIRSKIHNMNPLAKTICILLFLILSFLSTDIVVNVIITGIIVLIMGLTHIPLKVYIKSLYGLRYLIIFILLINLLMGTNIITVTIMLMRLVSLVLYTSILTLTTPPTEIAYGLEELFKPFKYIGVPVAKMALSISLALRFIPTIIDQANKILKTQASRGIDYHNSHLKGKLVALRAMLLPMFILSFKRADALADAMEVRLYSFNTKRTHYHGYKWRLFDSYIILMHLLMIIVLIVKEVVR